MLDAGSSAPRLPVRLFGPVAVGPPGAALGPREFGGVKPKQVLEMLLLERGRTVAKDKLAEDLWGARLPVSPVATLETYVSLLRRRLPRGHEVITTAAGGYRLAADAVATDLDEFDRLSQAGVCGDASERYGYLIAAVELGAEPVLADEPYADWVLPVRQMYADRHLQARVQLAECCLVLGRFGEAAEHAERALAADRLSERAARSAMIAHYGAGDAARALLVYGELRAGLAADLGVVPSADTNGVHAAVRGGGPPEALIRALPGSAPAIRFARNGDVRIAFETYGSGGTDILFVPQFLTNLGATWDEPVYAAFLHQLGTMGRVTIFDKRGSGLSDPIVEWPDHAARGGDICAVLDAAEVDRAVLFGVCDGGVMCVRFAADHPDRVAGLVLFGVPARLLACPDFDWGWSERFHDAFLASFEAAWARGTGLEVMDPSIATDPRYRALFARLLRLGASPGMARRLREVDRDLDIRPLLPEVHAPSLVLTRTADPWVRAENSRYLAEHLPTAELVELPGADHEPWLGDTSVVFDALQRFLTAVRSPATI